MTIIDPTNKDSHHENYLLPLINTVIFPHARTKILVDEETGDLLMKELSSPENAHLIGVSVQSDTDPADLSEEKLYSIGNLLEVSFIHKTGEGYLLGVQALDRVRIDSVIPHGDRFYATYTIIPSIQDIDEHGKRELLAEIKKTIFDIGHVFQGSEHIIGPAGQMESLDQLMGFIMPFIPVPVQKKQDILETDSLRTRYLMFLGVLLDCKENISLRIEMTKKVSEKSARNNREAMLREQIRAMQEELGDMNGLGQEDAGYRDRVMQSSMPDEVKKKALAEVKKLESSGNQGHESPVIRN